MTSKTGSVRMSADDRRVLVVKIALEEFAKGGLHGTSTESIAKRVGVSQPYLFRLFVNKQTLFLAAGDLCFDRICAVFDQVSAGLSGAEARTAMAQAYTDLIAGQPEVLLMQLQLYVASQDPDIRVRVRACWERLEQLVRIRTGFGQDEIAEFLSKGMLCNVIAALDLPTERYYPHI